MQLVPHYAEGVIYPLDNDEIKHWSNVEAKKGQVPDVLVDLMPGLDVTTIDFLRIQFHTEWAAFVQRMCIKYDVPGLTPAAVTERDFRVKDNGVFSAHDGARMDLMLWASERGQMLSRTVKGMMMYPAALRQLEFLEALHDHGGRLDQLVQSKFRCGLLCAMHSRVPRACESALELFPLALKRALALQLPNTQDSCPPCASVCATLVL